MTNDSKTTILDEMYDLMDRCDGGDARILRAIARYYADVLKNTTEEYDARHAVAQAAVSDDVLWEVVNEVVSEMTGDYDEEAYREAMADQRTWELVREFAVGLWRS